MKEKLTIEELFETILNEQEIDLITIHYPFGDAQYDNYESIPFKAIIIEDYEIVYDADEGLVYLDLEVE